MQTSSPRLNTSINSTTANQARTAGSHPRTASPALQPSTQVQNASTLQTATGNYKVAQVSSGSSPLTGLQDAQTNNLQSSDTNLAAVTSRVVANMTDSPSPTISHSTANTEAKNVSKNSPKFLSMREAMCIVHMNDLQIAAFKGDIDAVRSILDSGVHINETSKFGWTALHSAAMAGHSAIVALLLSKGINVHAKTDKGVTALHLATEYETPYVLTRSC